MAVVARYNPDGSLDPSFGTSAGFQLTSFSGNERAAGVALQPDGKIVAVGATYEDFLLARYNPNGSPRSDLLGRRHAETTDFGEGAWAGGVALQPDGKIVVAGAGSSGGGAGRIRARPLRGRIGLGHGTGERDTADDLRYRHRRVKRLTANPGRLDGQHPDQPELPVATLRLGGSQLR